MIVKEEFLSKLRRYFSLNLYEVKIWTALLSRGVSTAGELSDIANVPRSLPSEAKIGWDQQARTPARSASDRKASQFGWVITSLTTTRSPR